ncbi:MAG: amidohydrolase [Adhaeribacter sp.]
MIKSMSVLAGLLLCLMGSCRPASPVDLVVYNAKVYTVDNDSTVAEAFAVNQGKFVEVGSSAFIRRKYHGAREINLAGKPVYPGFIDAHAHFVGYAQNLQQADLSGTGSFAEVVARLVAQRRRYPRAAWLQGRGWDQNDWPRKEFPSNDTLNLLFPDVPVLIRRVDGHAALANDRALALAGITPATRVNGGKIETKSGRLTGLLVDNAVDLVSRRIPEMNRAELRRSLLEAQQNCFAAGLTTLDEAGLDKPMVDLLDSMQRAGTLKMRIYAMLTPTEENKRHYYRQGPYQTDRMRVRSFKIYADGALGSRGACLLQPYHDKPQESGFLLEAAGYYRQIAKELYQSGFQMNTHAIGDSANRLILDIYGSLLKGKNDRRWRIEHAQVVHPEDIFKFGRYSILPSVQPTHATSDMYWAGQRLGPQRLTHAYAYRDLARQNRKLALGSDFPVEALNPLFGFHAAIARQDDRNYPPKGFQPENALSRQDALRAMTSWAAFANFEEKEKGSIVHHYFADFVVLNQDIMTIPANKIRQVKVLQTFVNGEEVYKGQ